MAHGPFIVLILLRLTALTSGSWIDPDTPTQAYTTHAVSDSDDRIYDLVFSDEFEVEGRTYADGEDPRWTAMDKNDFTNNPLHYYSSESIQTRNGAIGITVSIDPKDDLFALDANNTETTESKEFKSGMLQSWNKFCFTGGIVEFSVQLPGAPNVGGLWPAIWMMGNLGRATYINSTENMWPFSANVCNNRTRDSQLVNVCPGADRIEGMPLGQGRGSPEVDILEVMYMDIFDHPVLSQSLQVAPGVPAKERPVLGHAPTLVRL
jgi:beta-glucan synthesis-associated protein KRE6